MTFDVFDTPNNETQRELDSAASESAEMKLKSEARSSVRKALSPSSREPIPSRPKSVGQESDARSSSANDELSLKDIDLFDLSHLRDAE